MKDRIANVGEGGKVIPPSIRNYVGVSQAVVYVCAGDSPMCDERKLCL